MTETADVSIGSGTPGALLRTAREQQGMALDTLAAVIKVRPAKLQALEADRYEELPDLAFTRGLAMAVCRALHIDAAPVLAGLPRIHGDGRLEQVATGLNTPFRDRPWRRTRREAPVRAVPRRPLLWVAGVLVAGAALLFFVPSEWLDWRRLTGSSSAGPVTEAPVAAPGSGASAVVETVFSAPVVVEAVTPPAASTAGLLVLRASAESWVEVRDAQGQLLLSRALQAGETVNVDGALPLRATIGNAGATSVSFRGQPLDLAAQTRDNIARLELK